MGIIKESDDLMDLNELLRTLKEHNIELKVEGDKIAVPQGMLTDDLRQAIIAHKPELIERLQADGIPVAAPTATKRKIPGTIGSVPIRLQYANNWFDRETLKIPTSNHGRQKARLTPPLSCHWLISWLSKAQRVELEAKGDLPWVDWNAVVGEVQSRFKGGANAYS